ncbi:MAG: transposase family protein [Mycobacterium sp.]
MDATLIPVHDQSISAISKNYRRSVNTQIIICADRRRIVVAGRCWPGNRNDLIVARHTVAPLLSAERQVLGDRGHRGIATITTPRRDHTGRLIRNDHYRTHRRIPARVEHVIARLKDRQILRQCRRHGEAINHSLQIIAGLWNLNTHKQLPVNS